MRYCQLLFLILTMLVGSSAMAMDEDPMAEYTRDINKPADANTNNVYNAWADNMAHRIKNGYADGVVIDGEGDYADGKIHADGLGNVYVDKNANVGPIINQTEIDNSNIIIQNRRRF